MSLKHINGSDGTGEAVRSSVTAIRAPGSTTITVDAVTRWPAFFIATAGATQADGTLNPSTALVFFGHKSGSTIIIDTVAPGYTDVGNSVGNIVLLKPTTAWADNFGTLLTVFLNDDGTFNTAAATDMAAKIAGKQIRLKQRLLVGTSTATLTPNIDTNNIYELNAQAVGLTIANPTGTPQDGDVILFRIKDNGTSQTIALGTAYTNVSGLDTPTATTISKWGYIGAMYNAGAAKYQIISITTEA